MTVREVWCELPVDTRMTSIGGVAEPSHAPADRLARKNWLWLLVDHWFGANQAETGSVPTRRKTSKPACAGA